MTYPTIRKVASGRWESEEQLNGKPDFVIERVGKEVRVKWRSSSKAQRFSGVREATHYLHDTFAKADR